jgi:hypothetical protein
MEWSSYNERALRKELPARSGRGMRFCSLPARGKKAKAVALVAWFKQIVQRIILLNCCSGFRLSLSGI